MGGEGGYKLHKGRGINFIWGWRAHKGGGYQLHMGGGL